MILQCENRKTLKMKETRLLLTICSLLLFFTGCEDKPNPHRVITGTGPVVSQTVEVSAFSKFALTGAADVYISIGDTQKVVLKAQQEILDVMTYVVSNDQLTVSFDSDVSVNTDEDIIIEITVPGIEGISVDGAGNFDLIGVKQDYLTIQINGSANIEAYQMPVDACDITINGVGNCWVHVNNTLYVTISGVGYVYYKGNPTVHSDISGVGNVTDDN